MDLRMKDRTEKRVIRFRVREDILKETTFLMDIERQVEFQQKCESWVNVSRARNGVNIGGGWREAKCSLFKKQRVVHCVGNTGGRKWVVGDKTVKVGWDCPNKDLEHQGQEFKYNFGTRLSKIFKRF